MMLTLPLFVGAALLLTIEGMLLLRLPAQRELTLPERWSLGFPVGAFLNVLLFFVLTVFKVPLTLFVVYGAHGVVIVFLYVLSKKIPVQQSVPVHPAPSPQFSIFSFQFSKILTVLLLLSLSIKVFYAFSHAVLLPSYYFDTVSQWNMRARISFEDRAIAFDPDESRGMSKPQYPILLHSLEILFMLPQRQWIDAAANASTLLLSLSSFVALFLLLRRYGFLFALASVALLLMVPLLSIHTAQGYGDIHVVEYLLLSAVFLFFSLEGTNNQKLETKNLLLSALFAAAAAWVKQEGLFFGVLPWLLLVGLLLWKEGAEGAKGTEGTDVAHAPRFFRNHRFHRYLVHGFLPAAFLGFLWTLFLFLRGLRLSPHGTELLVTFHREAFPHILRAMFSFGSFGIAFYVLPLVLFVSLKGVFPQWRDSIPPLCVLFWGVVTFLQTLFLFAFTPNVAFLLNNQTFHRTMLIPLSLLILGSMLLLKREQNACGWKGNGAG